MSDEAEGLDGHPPLGPHRHAVAEGFGDVVVRRRPARVEHRGGEDGALPGEDDDAAAIGAPGGEAEGGVEIQGRVEELGIVVVGKRVVVAAERVHLPGIHPEPLAEELRERQVHERRGGRVVGLGQQGEHVHRDDGSGVLVLGVPVAGEGLDLEEAAGPEPELARVQVQLVVDEAVVRHTRVAPSRRRALEDLEQIEIEGDAPLGQPVPALPPVAGETRPRPQVARIGRGRIGLRHSPPPARRRGPRGTIARSTVRDHLGPPIIAPPSPRHDRLALECLTVRNAGSQTSELSMPSSSMAVRGASWRSGSRKEEGAHFVGACSCRHGLRIRIEVASGVRGRILASGFSSVPEDLRPEARCATDRSHQGACQQREPNRRASHAETGQSRVTHVGLPARKNF